MIDLCYQDTATFVKVTTSGYGNDKEVQSRASVPVIFIQNTQFSRSNFQDSVESDAICFPDPENDFVVANYHRLEGMYVLAPLFGSGDEQSWYKVVDVTTNRDHLLENETDNIELRLKKTRPIPGVS
jgi:hypothetical protein